ncbi:Na+/H+ antiporter NhaC family protein [Adhaeretor mobilis]|uniref:Na+/H+ antiporter family protein n=1 Tax=Adhaeretor mobilis TaxID=1930276 RepID=A0A517MTP3_9BACT|nr:Na+/H+ antiporter NhaC family protein [Adhaeretor mobilis]QDS98255.1 Na+/H+ antiporter family protein [Adhaeretor mobilis]
MEPHPYGWLSLLPPVVAIALAIVTRKAAISLLAGVFCGALLTTGGSLLQATYDTCEVQMWPTFVDEGRLRVFSFTLLMGAMIGVICRSGGMQGFIGLISPLARTRRGGQLTTWLLGLLIFFDDYANTILLGGTLRPLCDRLKISREKLAYLVDSTAAPVAGLSLLSTWVAIEIDYVNQGIEALNNPQGWSAIDLFLGSIPYRFYVLASLVLVPLIAFSGRDFGPMLRAERRRLKQTKAEETIEEADLDALPTDVPARWFNAVLPIFATLGVVVWLMYSTGLQNLKSSGAVEPFPLRNILGAASSSLSLQYGALVGLIVAGLLSAVQRLMSWTQFLQAAGKGAKMVLPAIAILWCASSLSRMTGSKSVEGEPTKTPYEFKDHRLYTGDFLASKILGNSVESPAGELTEEEAASPTMTLRLMPTIVFVLAAMLAFATGTSYGTMGIMLPMVIPLTHALLNAAAGAASPTDPILLACVGGVLAGAIFGDHCSPISDTTILSSQACVCDHMAHVVTQMPYALVAGGFSILLGTLPLGWGVSVWLLLPLQVVALVVIVMTFGKKTEDMTGD